MGWGWGRGIATDSRDEGCIEPPRSDKIGTSLTAGGLNPGGRAEPPRNPAEAPGTMVAEVGFGHIEGALECPNSPNCWGFDMENTTVGSPGHPGMPWEEIWVNPTVPQTYPDPGKATEALTSLLSPSQDGENGKGKGTSSIKGADSGKGSYKGYGGKRFGPGGDSGKGNYKGKSRYRVVPYHQEDDQEPERKYAKCAMITSSPKSPMGEGPFPLVPVPMDEDQAHSPPPSEYPRDYPHMGGEGPCDAPVVEGAEFGFVPRGLLRWGQWMGLRRP